MNRELIICFVSLTGFGLGACVSSPAVDSPPHSLAAYQWLLGDWRADAGKQFVHEHWQIQDARSFAGIGGTENRETSERKESERIELVARDGKVFYIPTVPHNPAPVAFELINDDPDRPVFANPEHDFPKMIVYQRIDLNHLRVEVSDGGDKGFALEFEKLREEEQVDAAPGN